VPHWLNAVDRAEVARAVQVALDGDALDGDALHPVVAVHLAEVLTELHVAAAREVVWPAPITRVRRATGWADDVVPVRLSAVELAGVLSLPGLATLTREALTTGRSR
jgi:hypothetical protein